MPRTEGVYPTWSTYPPQGGPYSRRVFTVERVNGDGTTSVISCPKEEAAVILKALVEEEGEEEGVEESR